MVWLIVIIVLILAFGLIATIRIGQSQSNREESPRYTQQTGQNWLRLGVMYAIGVLAVVLVLILFI
jgi:ABC-type Fe3+ transport system permease subunit